jgi:selenide, water dikinase
MQPTVSPVLRDIVLVGGGHSHVGVLRSFGMNPVPGVRLTLICTDSHTPYSGMLPGYIAGHYGFDDVHIDVHRLARFANARFFRDEVVGLDRANRRVLCRDRPPVPYDLLSLNIGSTPQLAQVAGAAAHALPVKPIQQFNQRWLALLQRVREHQGSLTIAVVGAGAGGVELLLAMQYRLQNELRERGRDPQALRFHLFSAGDILPTHNAGVRRRFATVLAERGVVVHTYAEVRLVADGQLTTADGQTLVTDETVWVTQAGGAAWLRDTGLALDDNNFVAVNDFLQSTTDPLVFAAGDIASMVNHPLEKAGVFAVRQAAPLTLNLRHALAGQPLKAYRPQSRWLALISTGDRYAVASRGALGFGGDWVWRWKDGIDRRFMQRFQDLPTMQPPPPAASPVQLDHDETTQTLSAQAMRCGGCGAKVSADVLSRALARLQPLERSDVLIGLHAPDDAAVLQVPPGQALVHTVDFFRAFTDDPYLFGQIAANHALGDVFAMGAQPQSATAIATVPPGLESQVEDVLFQMMAGAVQVLNNAGCALVGGHTGEGQELALGFAVNGLVDASLSGVLRKGSMQAGDMLLLTKPLGTGTLLAAHGQLGAKGRWVDAALESMRVSSRQAAQCLREHRATACTDVTGFGLLGHLLEMTQPSAVDAQISLSALPVLDGAVETSAAGMLSSLHAANTRVRSALRHPDAMSQHPHLPLLFDPQTAGGLLASVPADQADACLRALHALGYAQAAVIGRVLPRSEEPAPITLTA